MGRLSDDRSYVQAGVLEFLMIVRDIGKNWDK